MKIAITRLIFKIQGSSFLCKPEFQINTDRFVEAIVISAKEVAPIGDRVKEITKRFPLSN